jgi:Predicted phosphohydrolases
MRFFQIAFMILMLGLFIGGSYYVFHRIWLMIPNNSFIRILLIILTVGVFLSLILFFTMNKVLPIPIMSMLYKIGTSSLFVFIYLIIIFLLLDLVRITNLLPIEKYMIDSWLGLSVLTGFITAIMLFGYVNYFNKEKISLSITIDNKNKIDRKLRIVAISDLHLGHSIGKKELKHWIELINKEQPDLLLIAGDVIDNDCRPLYRQQLDKLFHTIETKYGIYAALGNHEYISNVSNSLKFFQDAGIIVLRDSSVLIDDLVYLIGRDDRSNSERKPIEDLKSSLQDNKPIIMLDHQPYQLEEVEKNDINLQLSGHTHHGQLIPISWITQLMYEKSHGYIQKGNSHIYVSSGLGIWGGKFRIGSRSEYVVIDLTIK